MFRTWGLIGGAKLLPALVVAGIVAGGSYAFTASNTVAATPAGMGESAAISGYSATNVQWTLDATDPTKIAQVGFDLSPVTSSTTVYAGVDNGTTITWSSACSATGNGNGSDNRDGNHGSGSGSGQFTCTFGSEPTVSATAKLAVSAAN